MTVLVCDDREDDLALAVEAIDTLYHGDVQITQASRLSYAKHLLREHPFELIVLDLSYPDSEAQETWYSIKPLIREASVIIYSAYLDHWLMLHLIHSGVQHFIDKCNQSMITHETAITSIQREVLKLMAIRSRTAIEPTRAELLERIQEIEVQMRRLSHLIFEGNGDSLMTQNRLMTEAIRDIRTDLMEIKPQVSTMVQMRWGTMDKIVVSIIGTLGAGGLALLASWLNRWLKPIP